MRNYVTNGGRRYLVSEDGIVLKLANTDGMLVPVQCTYCGAAYDLCKGKPVQRYADCTVYLTPCCNRQVDDREWVGTPAFTRLG